MDDLNVRDLARVARIRERRLALLKAAVVLAGPGLVVLGVFLFISNLRYFLWNVQCYGIPTWRESWQFCCWLLMAIVYCLHLILPLLIVLF